MSFFGIPDYEPVWLNGAGAITAVHARRLESLKGRRLTAGWLVWDRKYESWLADCPVVLDFEGEQVEICHQKFDDLSITWNTIVRSAPIDWLDVDDGECQLEWRDDIAPRLAALSGRQLDSVDLLEWRGMPSDLANGAVAVNFSFGSEQVLVANGLDGNNIEFETRDCFYRIC